MTAQAQRKIELKLASSSSANSKTSFDHFGQLRCLCPEFDWNQPINSTESSPHNSIIETLTPEHGLRPIDFFVPAVLSRQNESF